MKKVTLKKSVKSKNLKIKTLKSKSVESKTALIAILIVVLCTAVTSSAQIFYKIGSGKIITSSILSAVTSALSNPYLWTGLILYGIGAIMLIIALKKGELSILYPIIALSYVWVSLLSMKFLGETMGLLKWLGVFVIIIGVTLIGIGSQQAETQKTRTTKTHMTKTRMTKTHMTKTHPISRRKSTYTKEAKQ